MVEVQQRATQAKIYQGSSFSLARLQEDNPKCGKVVSP